MKTPKRKPPVAAKPDAWPEQRFRFDATPVLITPPTRIYRGPPLDGVIQGTWRVRPQSRTSLRVTALDANLFLPGMLIRSPGTERFVEIDSEPIALRLAKFPLPPHLAKHFGALNVGTFEWRERFVRTTVGFQCTVPGFGRQQGVYSTVGWLDAERVLVAGAVAIIVRGLLSGVLLCCSAQKRQDKPTAPPAVPGPAVCDGRCAFRDSGATHNQQNFTDLQRLPINDGGQTVQVPPAVGNTTPANELGYVKATYTHTLANGALLEASGFFKKIEVEVTCDAPCVIESVTRTMTRLNGHQGGQPHGADTPDAIQPHSSPVQTPQRWVITDAPGFITQDAANRIFHKSYTVTATIRRPDGQTFTRACTYTILIRSDANGNIVPNPQPPP